MLKKLFCMIIVFAVVCSLTGCGFLKFDLSKEREPIDPAVSPSAYSRQVLQDMQDYLKNGDAKALSELFSEYYSANVDDVQAALAFFDGKIISFEETRMHSNRRKTDKNGEYILYSYGGTFYAVTDGGTKYFMDFAGYVVYDESPEKIGLEHIRIWDDPNEKPKIALGF